MTKNEYIVQCPRCGAEFPEREKFCPHCDTPNRKMICRSCGTQINASARVCPECGARNKKMISVQKIAILSVPFAAVVLAVVLIASKPAKKPAEPIKRQEPDTISASESAKTEDDAQTGETATTPITAEKTWGNKIKLTIPADFIGEDATQQALDEKVKETDGLLSIELNPDGSATYVMTAERHKELMQELAQNIDAQLADMAGSSDYPNVISAEASSDYTSFTVTLSTDVVGLQDSLLTLAFYMYGGMYNAFNGTPADNVRVQFVDQAGNVLEEANSRDTQ